MVELRIKIVARGKVEKVHNTFKSICASCIAVGTVTWQIACSIWKRFFDYNLTCAVWCTSIVSHKLQRKQLCVMLSFQFLSSLLFLMRHVGRHCNSSGHPTLFDNRPALLFLPSTRTHPLQSGAAPPPARCQMLWPGLQTICTPAGGGVKRLTCRERTLCSFKAEFQSTLIATWLS